MRVRLLSAMIGLTLVGLALAQTPATTPAPAAAEVVVAETAAAAATESAPAFDLASAKAGDATAGAAKAAACGACHGVDGNSTDPQYPKIAGQHEEYMATQLAGFKTGARANPIMLGFASTLTAQDMRDLGAYFSTKQATPGIASDQPVVSGEPLTWAQWGEQLYRGGDRQSGMMACMGCHGPSGRGNPGPSYPSIGGQHAQYTAARLQAIRETWECVDANSAKDVNINAMACVADKLTDSQIQALSTYLEGLHGR